MPQRARLIVALVALAGCASANVAAVARTGTRELTSNTVIRSPSGSAFELLEFVRRVGDSSVGGVAAGLDDDAFAEAPGLLQDVAGAGERALTSSALPHAQASGGGSGPRRRYIVESQIGRGACGEVWRARRVTDDAGTSHNSSERYVVKRLFSHKPGALLSGMREVHYGLSPPLRLNPHLFSRLVEHWETNTTMFRRAAAAAAAAAPPGAEAGVRFTGDTAARAPNASLHVFMAEDGRELLVNSSVGGSPPPVRGANMGNGTTGPDGVPPRETREGTTAGDVDDDDEVGGELWLVFVDDGVSLQRLLYQPRALPQGADADAADARSAGSASVVLEGSLFWARLHTEVPGAAVLRSIIYSLLLSTATLHREAGITHRDIKPSNVLIDTSGGGIHVRLADFGSAVDAFTLQTLYGTRGPSQDEETLAYAPPEVRLSMWLPYAATRPHSYDLFSLGITWLEVLLATPASMLFAVPPREEATLRLKAAAALAAAGKSGAQAAAILDRAVLAAGFRAWCIQPPEGAAAVGPPCGFRGFRAALRRAYRAAQKEAVATAAEWARGDHGEVHAMSAAAGVVDVARSEAPTKSLALPSPLEAVIGDTPTSAQMAQMFALAVRGAAGPLVVVRGQVAPGEDAVAATVPPLLPAPASSNGLLVAGSSILEDAWQLLQRADVCASQDDDDAAAAAAAQMCAWDEGNNATAIAEAAARAGQAHGDGAATPMGDADDEPCALLGEAGEELLFTLLSWEPSDRRSAGELLRHRYFHGR